MKCWWYIFCDIWASNDIANPYYTKVPSTPLSTQYSANVTALILNVERITNSLLGIKGRMLTWHDVSTYSVEILAKYWQKEADTLHRHGPTVPRTAAQRIFMIAQYDNWEVEIFAQFGIFRVWLAFEGWDIVFVRVCSTVGMLGSIRLVDRFAGIDNSCPK